jgi:hypothetical protein
VSTSIVSRASQGVSEAALAGQLDEALWTAWKLRGRQRDARRAALFLKAAKCLSITSLWIAIAGWLSGIALYDMVLRLSVTAGAVVVMSQALRLRRYAYLALFASLALLYNPVASIMSFSGGWQRTVLLTSAVPFAASLAWASVRPDPVADPSKANHGL